MITTKHFVVLSRINDMNHKKSIIIKGIREGLLIIVKNGSAETAQQELMEELTHKKEFWRGSRVILAVGQMLFTRRQLLDLQEWLLQEEMVLWGVLSENGETKEVARELGLATRMSGSQTDLDGNLIATEKVPAHSPEITTDQQHALFLRETVRSGRSIEHDQHIIIIGDVNPGAQIIAGGNVVVWGKLRGMVHAGANGNSQAIICALDLNPTQLRIADQIAISPEENHPIAIPEKAFIRDGQIVAEPWQKQKR